MHLYWKKEITRFGGPNHKTSFPFAVILTCLLTLISILMHLLTLAPSVVFADTFPVFGDGLHFLFFPFVTAIIQFHL